MGWSESNRSPGYLDNPRVLRYNEPMKQALFPEIPGRARGALPFSHSRAAFHGLPAKIQNAMGSTGFNIITKEDGQNRLFMTAGRTNHFPQITPILHRASPISWGLMAPRSSEGHLPSRAFCIKLISFLLFRRSSGFCFVFFIAGSKVVLRTAIQV
jgi:hypothetical protein